MGRVFFEELYYTQLIYTFNIEKRHQRSKNYIVQYVLFHGQQSVVTKLVAYQIDVTKHVANQR